MIRSAYLTALCATLVGAAWPGAISAQDVVWVSELESNSKLIDQEIVVEGRFQGRVGANLDQVRLKKCNVDKIEFRLGPDVDRKFSSNMQWIRLTGKLTQSGGKIVMRVGSWTKIGTTDEDRFREIEQRIGAADNRAWYKLADRTQRLAEFYDEDALYALARQARVNGFRAEEAALRSTQADELLALAARSAEVGLDAEESRRMRHKALRWQFDRLQEGNATVSQWLELADKISKLLPGAKVPLKPADLEAVNKYRAKPIDAYDLTPRIRMMADRDLWIEATTRSWLTASEQSNADIAKLASDAKRLVPDRPELSRQLLKKWAESEAELLKNWAESETTRAATPPSATQVRRLAETFRIELAEPQREQEVLRLWLDSRRKKLSSKDADGRVRLAKDFRFYLKDDETAAKLLLQAISIEADLPEAAEELKSLGFIRGPNGWLQSNDPSLKAKSGVISPSMDRLLKIDMTPKQVSDILGDPKPEDKIRFTNRGKDGKRIVIEQWTYRGPRDLNVSFQVTNPSDVRVIAINTQSQK